MKQRDHGDYAAPQRPGALPTADQVPATQPMPPDGTWPVNTIPKKISLESAVPALIR